MVATAFNSHNNLPKTGRSSDDEAATNNRLASVDMPAEGMRSSGGSDESRSGPRQPFELSE